MTSASLSTPERSYATGTVAPRNRGFSLVRGDFVADLDADDRWKPTRLERLLPLAEQHGCVQDILECFNGSGVMGYSGAPDGSGCLLDVAAVVTFDFPFHLVVRRDRAGTCWSAHDSWVPDVIRTMLLAAETPVCRLNEPLLEYRCERLHEPEPCRIAAHRSRPTAIFWRGWTRRRFRSRRCGPRPRRTGLRRKQSAQPALHGRCRRRAGTHAVHRMDSGERPLRRGLPTGPKWCCRRPPRKFPPASPGGQPRYDEQGGGRLGAAQHRSRTWRNSGTRWSS